MASYKEERSNRLYEMARHTPISVRDRIGLFRKKSDAQLYLMGRLLLQKALDDLGYHFSLDSLKYSQYNKPYIDGGLDFNISHSGDHVVCAISNDCRLGIDIERIISIDIKAYENIFSSREIEYIQSIDNPLITFYNIWTRKEAVIKADGCGLSSSLKELTVLDNEVDFSGNRWFLTEIKLSHHYTMHLATDRKTVPQEITFQAPEL